MSFIASIESKKNKLIWSKSILSLAAVSEFIKFVILQDSFYISAVNNSRTSHAEIIFKKSFFNEYMVDFSSVLPEGFETDALRYDDLDEEFEMNQHSYSFIINSRHLATLFKNLDANNMQYVCFRINWNLTSPMTQRYKFFIEIKTNKLIVKKYQTNYQPVLRGEIKIPSIYKKQLRDNPDEDFRNGNRINHIMIQYIIPKQFLEMVPPAAEDFRLDIRGNKVSFCGYTKQISKERDFLKQPMSVTVTIGLDELTSTNIQPTSNRDEGEQSNKISINFRLRDFKNFMNLITFLGQSSTYTEQFDENYLTLSNNDHFEIFFRNPGDPILFECQSNDQICVRYIQITADDRSSSDMETKQVTVDAAKNNSDVLAIPSHTIQRIENQDIRPISRSNSILSTTSSRMPLRVDETTAVRRDRVTLLPKSGLKSIHKSNRTRPVDNERLSEAPSSFTESNYDMVTYDDDSPRLGQHSAFTNVDDAHKADTDYSDSDDDKHTGELPKQRKRPFDQFLGPTQGNKRVTSLLD
ncbi:DDC1 [[Candida] subhashii]|uniref:DDC1 n=1 Tax=[Candida] subhashii TaxID=561895 RepID=A0A8J5QVY8_9ASCO|nr:DDC1 [[Candida] subhashii]KAG7663220.1 DDC1 [[Candida] subhashii]